MNQPIPKSERHHISLSLSQSHNVNKQKNRSGTPTARVTPEKSTEKSRSSTPSKNDSSATVAPKKVLKIVILDEQKKEKPSKVSSSDVGSTAKASDSQPAGKNGVEVTNGSKKASSSTTNGTQEKAFKPKADEVIVIDEDESPKKSVRESSRHRNTPTQEPTVKDEETKKAKKDSTPDTPKSTAATKSTRNAEKDAVTIGTPPATPPKKDEVTSSVSAKKVEVTSTSPKASASKTSKKASEKIAASESLLQEKTFKGFENDDMESLFVESEIEIDSPMPPKLMGKSPGGKVLRMSSGPPNRARISPFRRSERATQQNASTIVNLSTVSEQSTDAKSFISSSPAVTVPSEASFGNSMRVISGRRATRPLNDICLTAYRQLNDSTSSMNVTVGSEINNDSFRTPFVSVIGRKRFPDASPEYDVSERIEKETTTDSPKRARMEFSFNGLIDFVASPVTMLRNRLARAKLQSTPKFEAKMEAEEEEDEDKNDISGIDTTDLEKAATEIVDFVDKEIEKDEQEEVVADAKKDSEIVDMECDPSAKETVDVEDDIVVTETSANKRRNCSIM